MARSWVVAALTATALLVAACSGGGGTGETFLTTPSTAPPSTAAPSTAPPGTTATTARPVTTTAAPVTTTAAPATTAPATRPATAAEAAGVYSYAASTRFAPGNPCASVTAPHELLVEFPDSRTIAVSVRTDRTDVLLGTMAGDGRFSATATALDSDEVLLRMTGAFVRSGTGVQLRDGVYELLVGGGCRFAFTATRTGSDPGGQD